MFTPLDHNTLSHLKNQGLSGPYDLALIIGSGLGGLVEHIHDKICLPYSTIPHFPQSTVSGHAGTLVAGCLGPLRILAFQGRAHYYETGKPASMRLPIALCANFRIPSLLITNAAGSTTRDIPVGALVCIKDHINYSGLNPLIATQGIPLSDQSFVSMIDAYSPRLRRDLQSAAENEGISLYEGVYMWFSGPSFETPSEVAMAHKLGAHLVGMSTVPEVILARYYGLEVAALSVVTNYGAGLSVPSVAYETPHHETKAEAARASKTFERLILSFCKSHILSRTSEASLS
jgi:purine-nucleoside phosphorylase